MRKITYTKLWKLLIDKKVSRANFRRGADISSAVLTKLMRDENVSLSVLLKIAEYLDCNVGDICDFELVENS